MKNITVSVDDETYRAARMSAAGLDTSVSALVKQFLQSLSSDSKPLDANRLAAEEKALRQRISDFTAAGGLGRDALHSRRE